MAKQWNESNEADYVWMGDFSMRKKIYTADEEMRGVPELVIFAAVWYFTLIQNILAGGFHSSLLIFLVGGIFVPVQAVRTVQKALYYRKFHAQCMRDSYPMQGRIVNITREYYYEYDAKNRSRRTTCYFLIIEIVNPDMGIVQTVKSEAYRIPIYKSNIWDLHMFRYIQTKRDGST